MKSFKNLVSTARKDLIVEQDEQVAPQAPDNAPEPAANAPAPEPAAPAPQQEQPLSAEGTVMLVRLLVKAFAAKPSDDDLEKVVQMGEVTEYNANQIADQIRQLTKKYADTDAI